MTVAELRTLFRSQLGDLVTPYLVSDVTFLSYLNEAQEEACDRANLLFDKTSAFCTLSIVDGTSVYALNNGIYSITYSSLTDTSSVVYKLSHKDNVEMDRTQSDWRTLTGRPENILFYDNSIELSPVPDDTFTLKLECYRYPLAALALDADVPEIGRKHHRHLINWCLYRTYSMPDNEFHNVQNAEFFKKLFTDIFGEQPRANTRRKQYQNIPKHNKVYLA